VSEHRAVERERARLAAIERASRDAIISLSIDGTVETWNSGAEDLYGYQAEQVLGGAVTILTVGGGADLLRWLSGALSGATGRFEAEHLRRGGRRVDVEVRIAPILDSADAVSGVVLIAHDLSERRRVQRELARLSQAIEAGSDAIISLDLEACVRHWSPGAERLFGFSAEEVIGLRIGQLNALTGEPEAASDRWREMIEEVIAAESPIQHEQTRRHKNGTVIELLARIIPWRIAGQVVGVTGLWIDITAHKRAERGLARGRRARR
jgi:PAS domain S-box-containing protein